jgi:hypothetical protein
MLDPKEVSNLLDGIRNASNSLLNSVNAKAGIALDVKAGLEAIKTQLVKLLDIQAEHREELKQIIQHFAPSLREAYDAVSEAGSAIDTKKRPDLDQ